MRIIFVLLAFFPVVAAAGLVVTLDQPAAHPTSVQQVSITGTLTNVGVAELFLNGTALDVTSFEIVADDTLFYQQAPLSLAPGASFQATLFVLSWVSIEPGSYDVKFAVFGGPNPEDFEEIGGALITLQAQEIPEPRTLVSVLLAGVFVAVRRRITARRNPPGVSCRRRSWANTSSS
jgi:hypothetical protein